MILNDLFQKTKKLFTFRNLLILGLIILALTNFVQCNGKKKAKEQAAELERYKLDYEQLSSALDSLATEYSSVRDDSPKGTVVRVDTLYKNHTTFEKNWLALQDMRTSNERLRKQLEEAKKANEAITKEQFDKDGGVEFEWVDPGDALPVIETVKIDKGKNYEFEARIESRGALESYSHTIKVTPEIITVKSPPEIVKEKNRLTGLSTGIIHMFNSETGSDVFIPVSLFHQIHSIGLEAGPIMSHNFKNIEGIQVKVIAGIRY